MPGGSENFVLIAVQAETVLYPSTRKTEQRACWGPG
jgi:hypothetical protein